MNLAQAIYHFFYRRRKREAESSRASLPGVRVISVGNLSTGGTGKTPAVQTIARLLQARDLKTVVVARGYGGALCEAGGVVSDGVSTQLTAGQAGDEALLHARALHGVPVVIGRDRVRAAHSAIEKFAPDVILLDDGFQYWSLGRDLDIVLLDARNPFAGGLLPSGRLREPKEELRRADIVVLTRSDLADESQLEQAQSEIAHLTNAPIFAAKHRVSALRDEASGAARQLSTLRGQRVAALCALADNEQFLEQLRKLGAEVASTLSRRDHHQWSETEVRRFCSEASQSGASVVVTSEKDAVKINTNWCAPLSLQSVVIEMEFENAGELEKRVVSF